MTLFVEKMHIINVKNVKKKSQKMKMNINIKNVLNYKIR